MKKIILFLTIIIGFTIPLIAQESTKGQALEIAKKEFQGQDVDYYILEEDASATEWVLFVDAEPLKGWEHECYKIRISKSTPSQIVEKTKMMLPPREGNYVPLSVKNRYESYAAKKPLLRKKKIYGKDLEVAKHTYAIILSGGIDKLSNYERYWNDCSFIYQTLVNTYGVPKENIYPIMSDGDDPAEDVLCYHGGFKSQDLDLDGDGIDEIKLSATRENIKETLDILLPKMGKDDQLFFFTIDHGGTNDGITASFIHLWGWKVLHDYTLAEWLEPFTNKLVNVNVVLGQCYSGGFVDNLTKSGCVIATASTGMQSSGACPNIPYDEFVYHWTCAINGANHLGISNNYAADIDNNGVVTMEEAFIYAEKKDTLQETPVYLSTPTYIGESLAFNKSAKTVDLYVKDNSSDTGKEFNNSTDKTWISPSIWVRNEDDGIEIHENPISNLTHKTATVYVKINNRGREPYKGGKWVHLYWAKASTVIEEKSWTGNENFQNNSTGGHIADIYIEPIKVGGSRTVKTQWNLPEATISFKEIIRDDYCIRAKISDYEQDDVYTTTHIDTRSYNNLAQKNVSIVNKRQLKYKIPILIRNIDNIKKRYTIELVPRTLHDKVILSKADIEMELGPVLFNGLIEPLEKSKLSEQDNNSVIVKFPSLSKEAKIDVDLEADALDKLGIKFNFKAPSPEGTEYTIDLLQKDENGAIIGGQTFIVEAPDYSDIPIVIEPSTDDSGKIQLTTNGEEFETIRWYDTKDETIGTTSDISVIPTAENQKFKVVGITEEGTLATETIHLDYSAVIKTVVIDGTQVSVEFSRQPQINGVLEVVSVLDNKINDTFVLNDGTIMTFDISNYSKGIYNINYYENDIIIDSQKIVINK